MFWWVSSTFMCFGVLTFSPVPYSTSNRDFLQLPCMPRNDCHGLYGGARAAAEQKGSCCCHMKLHGAPVLLIGFNLPAGWWSLERQMICNKTWCLPFGTENPICRRAEKERQIFLCCSMRLFWFFFCSFMYTFYLDSSLMSSVFPF